MITIKKRAFSLIEILQTVILVGIIAGLSVSFFKKVNNDDKLMMSTARLVSAAIEEANLQMCSDETPYCQINGENRLVENPSAICNNFYPGSTFDEKGFCVFNRSNPGVAIPTFQNPTNYTSSQCQAGSNFDADGNCSHVNPALPPYAIKDFTMQFYGKVNGIDTYTARIPCVDGATYYDVAQPLSAYTCKDNIPQWNAQVKRNIEPLAGGQVPNDSSGVYRVSEICYRLWDIINHKAQRIVIAGSTVPDLYWTCVEFNQCINTQNCDNSAGGYSTNKANMILPNGARLYNLACVANTNCSYTGTPIDADDLDYQHIFIKADRVPDDRTFKFDSTSTGFINTVKWYDNNIWDGAAYRTGVDANLQKSAKISGEEIDTKYNDNKVKTMRILLGKDAPAP